MSSAQKKRKVQGAKKIDSDQIYLEGKTAKIDIYMGREGGTGPTQFTVVCDEFDVMTCDRSVDVARKQMKAALDELLATTWERYLEVDFDFGSTATCDEHVSAGSLKFDLKVNEIDFGTRANGDKVHRDAREVAEDDVKSWRDIDRGWPDARRGKSDCSWFGRRTESQSNRVYLKATPENRAALNKIVFALTQAGEMLLKLTDPDSVGDAFARIAASPSLALLGPGENPARDALTLEDQ